MSIKIGINGTTAFNELNDLIVGTSDKTKQDINRVEDWNGTIIWQRSVSVPEIAVGGTADKLYVTRNGIDWISKTCSYYPSGACYMNGKIYFIGLSSSMAYLCSVNPDLSGTETVLKTFTATRPGCVVPCSGKLFLSYQNGNTVYCGMYNPSSGTYQSLNLDAMRYKPLWTNGVSNSNYMMIYGIAISSLGEKLNVYGVLDGNGVPVDVAINSAEIQEEGLTDWLGSIPSVVGDRLLFVSDGDTGFKADVLRIYEFDPNATGSSKFIQHNPATHTDLCSLRSRICYFNSEYCLLLREGEAAYRDRYHVHGQLDKMTYETTPTHPSVTTGNRTSEISIGNVLVASGSTYMETTTDGMTYTQTNVPKLEFIEKFQYTS